MMASTTEVSSRRADAISDTVYRQLRKHGEETYPA